MIYVIIITNTKNKEYINVLANAIKKIFIMFLVIFYVRKIEMDV